MKSLRTLVPIMLGIAIIALYPVRAAGQTAAGIDTDINTIRTATTPAAAMDAYTEGIARDPDDVQLREAYLQRMVDFGLVDSLNRQAEILLNLDPENGLALAIVAFHRGRQGDMERAFSAEVEATEGLPDNQYVQQLAGQLVAWYDNYKDTSTLAPSIAEDAETLRETLSGGRGFTEAYRAASDALRAGAPAEAAAAGQGQYPAPEDQSGGGTADSYDYGYYPYTEAQPYASYYPWWYYSPDYYWPDYYWPYFYPPTVLFFGVSEGVFDDRLEDFLEHHHGFREHHRAFESRFDEFLEDHPKFVERHPGFIEAHRNFFAEHPQFLAHHREFSTHGAGQVPIGAPPSKVAPPSMAPHSGAGGFAEGRGFGGEHSGGGYFGGGRR